MNSTMGLFYGIAKNAEAFQEIPEWKLRESPYVKIIDNGFVGEGNLDESILKGAVVGAGKKGSAVCFLVSDGCRNYLKIAAKKPSEEINFSNILKVEDDDGCAACIFLHRKEAVQAGDLSAFCKPTILSHIADLVTKSAVEMT